MRRRLIQSTLAVVLVVIAVFGVSLVIVETRTISNSAQERVDSEAVRLAKRIHALDTEITDNTNRTGPASSSRPAPLRP